MTQKHADIINKAKYNFKEENLIVKDYNFSDISDIEEICKDSQNVLLISTNKALVSRALSSVGALDIPLTVFSFEALQNYNSLDINNLMSLNVHIINTRSIDLNSHFDTTFVNSFQKNI